LLAAATLSLATIAFAQAPPPGPARPIQWPSIIESKLSNGLTVVLVPLHNVPKITTQLSFLAGRGTAYKTEPGVAQLAARVANEGTATRSSIEIKQQLRSIGGALSIGVDNDATTMTASSLAEFAPKLLDLLSDVARHPAYPQSEVALAKTNLAQEIEEQRSTPDFLAQEELDKALFGTHPYGFTVPDPASIKHVTRAALKTFAAAYYAPNNATLVVVGDFEPATMRAEVERARSDRGNAFRCRQLRRSYCRCATSGRSTSSTGRAPCNRRSSSAPPHRRAVRPTTSHSARRT
jgi:predicted Zn-dependent peptidase